MPNYELLNNIDHKDLKVVVDRSAEYGDDVWFAATFPSEFRNVQRHYPIIFTKNSDSGAFEAVAVASGQRGNEPAVDLFAPSNGLDCRAENLEHPFHTNGWRALGDGRPHPEKHLHVIGFGRHALHYTPYGLGTS